jgi:hypothetical protein
LPPTFEVGRVTNRCYQGAGGDRSDAGDFGKFATWLVVPVPLLDLPFKFVDFRVENLKVTHEACDKLPETPRQVDIVDYLWYVFDDL